MIAIICTVVTIVFSFVAFIVGCMAGMYICIEYARKQKPIKWTGKDIYFTIKEYDSDEY